MKNLSYLYIIIMIIVIFFVNGIQQHKFKAKDTEINSRKLCLGFFSDDSSLIYFALSNGKIYHFFVDYQPATIDKIQKIHKYLMKKLNIK